MTKPLLGLTGLLRLSQALTASVIFATPVLAQIDKSEYAFILPKAQQSLLLDAVSVDGRTVVVGERGHILVSDDMGISWRQAEVPTRSMLTGVDFIDPDNGCAVGHDAVILCSGDGGQTWKRVYFDPDDERPLFDILFLDADNAIAVGAYGLYMETDDGGANWSVRAMASVPFAAVDAAEMDDETADQGADYAEEDEDFDAPEDFHLNQIVRAADGRLYIAAEAGHFYRSDDDGATWLSMDMPYQGSYYGSLPLPDEGLLVVGMRGNMFRSDDHGESWDPVDANTAALLNDGLVLPDGRIVVVGLAGTVLLSEDGGRSFVVKQQKDRMGISRMLAADGDHVIVVGEAGVTRMTHEEYLSGGS